VLKLYSINPAPPAEALGVSNREELGEKDIKDKDKPKTQEKTRFSSENDDKRRQKCH
jgi:hypothetical protein